MQDTVASMVGAIVGALHGKKLFLPDEHTWVRELENKSRGRDYALKMAGELANLDLHSEGDIISKD